MKVINPFSHVLDNQMNEIVLYLLKQIATLEEKLDLLQRRLDDVNSQCVYAREDNTLDLSALNGDGDGFAPAGDEFGEYGDLASDVRRGYVAARVEDDSTC